MHPLLEKLAQGDMRTTGRSDEVVAEALAAPDLFSVLVDGLRADDAGVRMRAADAIEKITHARPEFLTPHKKEFLRVAITSTQQEVRWHMAQIIPRLNLTRAERRAVLAVLADGYLADKSAIVKTFAMQAMADLAEQDDTLREEVIARLTPIPQTGTPAMRARGKKLLSRLSRGL
ncbi:MAG TPA: hypothetical protein PLJ62_11730 [Thermoflexales bacterium]|nr:hypothetical protein [Thermoflexales bacterium]HQW36348.1 hypothetical protein [Thermoflexales bacterium]HQZ20822.1 hypothetical protein [Thermoflexales bacterium]HRA00862.1 hypothetical protein [Thermoflexales bacterium]